MRFVTRKTESGPRLAAVRDSDLIDLNETDPQLPASMLEFLAEGPAAIARAEEAISKGRPQPRQGQRLAAPVPTPEKIICIGLNYADHAAESGAEIPSEPVVFCKFATSVCGHEETIALPRLSEQVDYEAELVVVIGRGGRHIPTERAMDHVFGYACGHDVSARDWQLQKPGGQWLLGKSFDGFAPFGPHVVSKEEVGDPSSLDISLRLNGQTMQQSNTRQLIFPVDRLVSYLSGVCTLKPGDIIFTGTPPGVGAARKPPVFLQPGDEVEVEIENVGLLRNRFAAES